MLLSDAKRYIINGKEAKELWFGGNKVWEAQKEYTLLEYVQTSSSTGGIDIGYIPTNTTKMELTFAQLGIEDKSPSSQSDAYLFDAGWGYRAVYRHGYGSGNHSHAVSYSFGALGFTTGYIESSGSQARPIIKKNIKTVLKVYDKKIEVVGGETGGVDTGTGKVPNTTLLLGGAGYSTSYNFCPQKIYSCKITNDDGVLVRDLIPVLKTDDQIPYLYDLVNREYYGPQKGILLCKGYADTPTLQ